MADTREEILEAAWDLFAEKGFEDVSVRDVTNAAGVNLASVSYHFGGKNGLIQEVVKRCLNPLYEHGMQLLNDAKLHYGSYAKIPMKEIMISWLRPTLLPEECAGSFDLIARLTARYLIDATYEVPLPSMRLMNESFECYVAAISAHGHSLSKEQIIKQLIFIQGAAIYAAGIGGVMMQIANGDEADTHRLERERVLEEVVACAMLGFQGEGSCIKG